MYQIKINRGTKTPQKRAHVVNYTGVDLYGSARVFGCGNPRTTGSTGGERTVISRRNVSAFVTAGTAYPKDMN